MDGQGKIIKALCIQEGVSLTLLAEKIGISRQALYKRLEGGITLSHFEEILSALGYSLYYGKDGNLRKLKI